MSELKEHQFCESDEFFREYPGPLSNELHLYYLKSEADKVIAEMKADYKEACGRLQTANLIKDEQLAATRHQKYKRCLVMAMWCRIHDEFTQLESEQLGLPQRTLFLEYRRKAMWWNKWHKRWLELAEKFKEAK